MEYARTYRKNTLPPTLLLFFHVYSSHQVIGTMQSVVTKSAQALGRFGKPFKIEISREETRWFPLLYVCIINEYTYYITQLLKSLLES